MNTDQGGWDCEKPSPVFVRMFMTGAGISPELTQAAYRLADSSRT